jgi:tetratricopeptide (TPR) repeat protein
MTNSIEDQFQQRLSQLKDECNSRPIDINDQRLEGFFSQLDCHPSELLPRWQAISDAAPPGTIPNLTPSLEAEVCLMIGAASLKEKRWNKALVWLKASWEIYKDFDDLRGLAESSYLLATGHNLYSNPSLAHTYYRDAGRLFQELRDTRKLALSHNGLGILLLNLGRHDQAKAEFDQAFDIYQTISESQQMTDEIINIRFYQGIVDGILSPEKVD